MGKAPPSPPNAHLGALREATKPVFSPGAIFTWSVNVFPYSVIAQYIRG